VSTIKRKLYLTLIEHPKVVFSQILKSLKWVDGNVYEEHQNTHLYIFPAEIFQEIRLEIRNTVGKKVAYNLLYSLNQLSADLIIKDAIEQNFNSKDLFRYFLGIMGLFGWGFSKQFDFDPETGNGMITISNFPKLNINQIEPVHDDFAGIIARALQLSFGGNYDVHEITCCEMTSEALDCSYQIKPLAEKSRRIESKAEIQHVEELDVKEVINPEEFNSFIGQLSMPENGVLMLEENGTFKRIVIKDVQSINSMFLKTADLIGWKTMGSICFRVGRNHVIKELEGKGQIDLEFVHNYLHRLTLFGWGFFDIQANESKYHLMFWKHPFTTGFPPQQSATDYLVGGIINGLFELLEGKRVNVKEVECMAKGDNRCLFEVT
jgi:predicted hydrocarbon binding protein